MLFVAFGMSPFLSPFRGHFTGKWPFCLHLAQYGGFGQLCFKCPTSPQFQQIGPDFPIDVKAEDDADGVGLTPCLFALLDPKSHVDGESVLSAK